MKKILLPFSLLLASCVSPASESLFVQKENQAEPLSVQAKMQTEKWARQWWIPRHKEKLLVKDKMDKVDLIFLGDSITHGWDTKAPDDWQRYYGKRNALNIGFNGDRTEHVLWRLQNGEVDGIDPKLVVLMIGTNNTKHRNDNPKDTALGIKRIIEELKNRLPNAQVLLLAIFPRGANVNDPLRKINAEVNTIIKSFDDEKRVHYLDINHIFIDEKGNLSKSVMKDLLHPNPNQYKFWGQAMESKISTLLND
jgi:beta-glucosidase